MKGLLLLLFSLIAILIIAAKSLIVVKEDERLVVFRLGKVLEVRGAGLNFILPFVDRAVRVNVEKIAGWKRLSDDELQRSLVKLATSENE